jgi:hypothetical protein
MTCVTLVIPSLSVLNGIVGIVTKQTFRASTFLVRTMSTALYVRKIYRNEGKYMWVHRSCELESVLEEMTVVYLSYLCICCGLMRSTTGLTE